MGFGKETDFVIYVISKNGQPLMPTENHAKVRILLKNKKAKGKNVKRDIRYYAQQVGMNYLSACQFERIMARYNVRSPEELLDCPQEVLAQFQGIGVKRLQQCIDIKCLISKDRKKKK